MSHSISFHSSSSIEYICVGKTRYSQSKSSPPGRWFHRHRWCRPAADSWGAIFIAEHSLRLLEVTSAGFGQLWIASPTSAVQSLTIEILHQQIRGGKKNVSEPSFFGESMSWRNHPTPVNYAVSIPHGLVTSFTLLQHVVVFASLKKNCCQPAVFHEKKMGNHRHQDIMQKQPHISCKKKVFKQNIRISST